MALDPNSHPKTVQPSAYVAPGLVDIGDVARRRDRLLRYGTSVVMGVPGRVVRLAKPSQAAPFRASAARGMQSARRYRPADTRGAR